MRALLLAALACGLQGAADKPSSKGDEVILKGSWKPTLFVKDGQTRDVSGTTITLDGESIIVKHDGDSEPPTSYTLDPATKAIDLWNKNEGKMLKGIYKLEGKNLTFCLHEESRPTEFDAEAGSGNLLIKLERQ
jgi:uncharacterized protein (TIGR03067 family)